MGSELPIVYLVRHGDTQWSRSGRHTGLTDIALSERGEHNAASLAGRLRDLPLAAVFTSPLRRATRTCELAGFASTAKTDSDLLEWNYGDYEGERTRDIRRGRPGWQLFRDGCPGGESPNDVAQRAERVIARVRAIEGGVLIFSSGHFMRVLAARWLALAPLAGGLFVLATASVSELGYEHDRGEPAIRLWNDTRHLGA